MITFIENWIDETLNNYSSQKQSCSQFSEEFKGFYPLEFLQKCNFVVVNKIPKPDHPSLIDAGLGSFIDEPSDGITYKNTYFIKSGYEQTPSLHFHELVHVLQWNILGVSGFINRYIYELKKYGYDDAPLEVMAYYLEDLYSNNEKPIDVSNYVNQKI
ncbi:hypothetical protein GCM10009133_10790 [Cocleimonas flava]|uniref:DUF4157 domain-containing protein n=1 Tax=Cocleimonas flava TaxID=634765 RepID=A0A4R1F216_9GAMM|nr:hypothetical protein [Cocleimonas flava]TCJ87440.1 hypothetical protein EV695_1950 [Cocleimonas flava]